MDRRIKRNLGLHRSRTRTCVEIGNLTDGSVVDYLACDLWKDDYTSHLRGGAGSGRASCIGGATLNHRLNSTTPLTLMQIGKDGRRDFPPSLRAALEVPSAPTNHSAP